jgi:hypothetical protein
MISKALKGLPRKVSLSLEEPEPTKFRRAVQIVVNAFKEHVYYPIDSFINRTRERASRSLAFAKHGWMHYDFESAYIYDIMAFKMKRIYACLQDGHAIQHDEDMKALKEAIAICERLFAGNYEDKHYRAHDKKWGKMKTKTIPEYDANGKHLHSRWESSRPKAKTPAQIKKEREDLKKVWENGEIDRKADLDRLNEILKKHEPTWWD